MPCFTTSCSDANTILQTNHFERADFRNRLAARLLFQDAAHLARLAQEQGDAAAMSDGLGGVAAVLEEAFLLPFGAPGDAPPCIRQRPFAIAGDWHGVPLRVRAPQRGLRCMGNLLCMGLFLRFSCVPTPRLPPTMPTTACPPAWTWTCSTVTFCWPLPRWRLRASSSVA